MDVPRQLSLGQRFQARLPHGMIARYRLLILLVSSASTIAIGLAIGFDGGISAPIRSLQVALLALIIWRWCSWYTAGRIHRADILLEAAIVAIVTSLLPDPGTALAFVYVGAYYRPLFTTNRQTAVASVAYVSAYCVGVVISTSQPLALFTAPVLTQVPILLILAFIVRIVAAAMHNNDVMTRELAQAEREYRTLVEQLPGVVISFDHRGYAYYVSPRIHDVLGYSPSEIIAMGRAWSELIHPDDRARVAAVVERSLATREPIEWEYRVIRADGVTRWLRFEAITLDTDGADDNWRGVLTDVTEQHELAEQLSHQAFHDALTDLPNRALFEARLAHTIQQQSRRPALHAILFLDLDSFKIVNDSLGHRAGDQLLISAAERIKGCLRPGDTVARLGGDEFAILLEHLESRAEARQIADRIRDQITVPFQLSGYPLYVSASIGIAFNLASNIQPEDLLRQADVAMYEAKRAGKACHVVFDDEMDERAWERLEREAEIRGALDRQEFFVCYQPVVDLHTGAIQELEALVRWEHPTRGLLKPDEFMPLAEEIGLMPTLDIWVMEQACRQARDWQQRFPEHQNLVMSVNVSPGLLREPTLASSVANILARTGLAPDCLKLEVTENAMLNDIEHAMEAIKSLSALGVQIAIDDFGAGSSALSYLRHLPIGTLKIDRSYIADLDSSPHGLRMMTAIVNLAKSLGLTVTAEGIEHRHQTHLQALGCDLGQGFYFARPVPTDQMEVLLETHIAFEGLLDLEDQRRIVSIIPRVTTTHRGPERAGDHDATPVTVEDSRHAGGHS